MTTATETTFDQAERALELEWQEADPSTPADVAGFYQRSRTQAAQLNAWHAGSGRDGWTTKLVAVARQLEAQTVLDIGSGNGQDLLALRTAGVSNLWGVEPNDLQRNYQQGLGLNVVPSIDHVPPEVLATADLILCLDVLEHLPEPDAFLETWCPRARIGASLVERTNVWDTSTPLHLAANRGWSPGRTLERHGWDQVERDEGTYLRLWRRNGRQGRAASTGVVQVIYESLSVGTYTGMLELLAEGWRTPLLVTGDSLLPRGRSQAFSYWWRETADDVCLMIDSNIGFEAHHAERLADWCRQGYDVICAPVVLRDGSKIAVQTLPQDNGVPLKVGPGLEPMPIHSIAPGFLAVHRRVLDALIPTMQLVHENQPISFWPLCLETIEELPQTSPYGSALPPLHAMLSEDWAFSRRVAELGIGQWMARDLVVSHRGAIQVSLANMDMVSRANAAAKQPLP